ncbi:MAG: flavodoxin domain-containing protein [Eubacteriales bacterium]|nr:flavodoxin domain-containing protein [Eubacteriales bacterium]
MTVTNDIKFVGVNDHQIDLFEGHYEVPLGMAYNSYVIMDEKIAVMDSVDVKFTEEWLGNIEAVLGGKKPEYLIIQHMEPDHSASIKAFLDKYPEAKAVATAPAFKMLGNYFRTLDISDRKVAAANNGTLELGSHTLTFVFAPMVHWPEVMMTYDSKDKVLFTADGFGKFGANDVEDPEGWDCEARRYYFGIVGKFGAQVQAVLKKAAALDIAVIAPLHGPVLTENLGYYINKYDIWSSYRAEDKGVTIAYTSVYGHTKEAAELLAAKLEEKGCPEVEITDIVRDDVHEAIENAFRYDRLVLATTTYNNEMFPNMRSFIDDLVERGYKNRTVAIIENGSWGPQAAKCIKAKMEGLQNISWLDTVTILSSMSDANADEIDKLADALMAAE